MVDCGKKGRAEAVVTKEMTALHVGSGSLEVYATPMLVALMENASVNALDILGGQTSVGTFIEVKHLAATPLGMKVWAEAEVVETEGRRRSFRIDAFDEKGKIGEGKHERIIVESFKFMNKTKARLEVDNNV